MKHIFTAIIASMVLISPVFADHERWGDNDRGRELWSDNDRGHERWGDNGRGHDAHAAPGPIAGAGLPFLAVGYGVYWLIKRRRRRAE